MIRRDLEGRYITSKKDAQKYYKEYLESYYDSFYYYTVKGLNTRVSQIYNQAFKDYNGNIKQSETILETYNNYLFSGKLYGFVLLFWDFKSDGKLDNNEYLITLLKNKGYNIQILIEDLIKKYIETLLDRVYYVLNQGNICLIISNLYNLDGLEGRRNPK